MDLISRDKAQDAVFSKEDIMGYMDGVEDGDINRTIRSAIRLIERVPSAFEGKTNGYVIISLYPNLKYTIQNGRVVTTIGVASSFDLEWWNSPYRKGGEGDK